MKRYDDYQVVAQKWVNEIPEHWNFYRIKRIFAQRVEKNDPVVTENILSLTAKQGVVPIAEKEGAGGNKPKGDMTQYNVAHPDDLLVNCMNIVAGSAGVSRYFGAISPVYYALYPRLDCNVWYYHYLFRLMPFQRSLLGLGKGILMHESDNGKLNTVRMRISMDNLGNVPLPVPPRAEQDQIVRYLDWQVSKINRLIAAKRKQIDLMRDNLKSAVTYYTTHGIGSHELCQSEIYWLMLYPNDWRVTKLRYILEKHRREVKPDAELLICSNSGEVVKRGDGKLGLVASSDDIYQGVTAGDLLIHGMDTWHGAIAISSFDGMCTPVVHVCTCKEEKRYVAYYLKMMAYTKVFKAISNGVRQNTSDFRSWDKVGDLLICLPSYDEQVAIADKLDHLTEQTKAGVSFFEREIEKLQELRTRLISDVVTGQVDVRDIEVPEFEYTADADPSEDESAEDIEPEPEEA